MNIMQCMFVLLFLLVPGAVLQAQDQLYITIPDVHCSPDENVQVEIKISGTASIAGMGFTLIYDQEVLVFDLIELGPTFQNCLMENNSPFEGILKMSFVAPQVVKGEGILCILKFKAAGKSGTFSDLILTDIRAYNEAMESIDYKFSPGQVIISNNKN